MPFLKSVSIKKVINQDYVFMGMNRLIFPTILNFIFVYAFYLAGVTDDRVTFGALMAFFFVLCFCRVFFVLDVSNVDFSKHRVQVLFAIVLHVFVYLGVVLIVFADKSFLLEKSFYYKMIYSGDYYFDVMVTSLIVSAGAAINYAALAYIKIFIIEIRGSYYE